jgi:hypothetical protein
VLEFYLAKETMAYKGRYRPINPQKYKGKAHEIIYRSSWELSYMMRLDKDPNVLEWESETFCIPYTNPLDGTLHRYFPDFRVKKKDKDGMIRTYVIEIKPHAQTKQPKMPVGKKITKGKINEIKTFAKNTGKWQAAERYCGKMGYQFVILTEKELGLWV